MIEYLSDVIEFLVMAGKFLIKGQKTLNGTIQVKGAKNAALKVAATFSNRIIAEKSLDFYRKFVK